MKKLKKNIKKKLKTSYGLKKYKIQEVIKPGQVILDSSYKEERGQKGAALTTFISLAGKYMVFFNHILQKEEVYQKNF